jgi:hypothetical protein
MPVVLRGYELTRFSKKVHESGWQRAGLTSGRPVDEWVGDLASTDEGMARVHSMATRPAAVFGGLWQVIMILRFASSFAELRLYSVRGRVRIDSGDRSAGMHVRKAGKEEEEAKQAIFPA